jgi:hypothetical protein
MTAPRVWALRLRLRLLESHIDPARFDPALSRTIDYAILPREAAA